MITKLQDKITFYISAETYLHSELKIQNNLYKASTLFKAKLFENFNCNLLIHVCIKFLCNIMMINLIFIIIDIIK